MTESEKVIVEPDEFDGGDSSPPAIPPPPCRRVGADYSQGTRCRLPRGSVEDLCGPRDCEFRELIEVPITSSSTAFADIPSHGDYQCPKPIR